MRWAAVCGVIFSGVLAAARDTPCAEPLPGHSHFGEAFDSGARQSAYLMGGTGNVHFPVSSKNPLVQKFIEQGIGQLHGFWYSEAERSFREAARLDPQCGIAYWGMSQAAWLNKPRAAQFATQASKHKAGLSEREAMYIEALSDDAGYRALARKYPRDLEAKAFEVWRLWHKSEAGAATPAELESGLGLAREILAADPMHPIHHAVIHITDALNQDRRGLDSAKKCGDAAPSIGHMWHMPTHIYAALRRYPEAAWQLEAAARTEHARSIRDHVLPYQVHLYAHNNEWLVRMLLNVGRVHDARRVAMQMIDLPRHPLFNAIEPPEGESGRKNQDSSPGDEPQQERLKEGHGTCAYYGRERLMQVLRRYEYWGELIDLCRSGYIEMTHLPTEEGKIHTNCGVACYCQGDQTGGDRELAAVRQLRDEQLALRQAAMEEANGRSENDRSAALRAADKPIARSLNRLNSQIEQLESYRRIVTGFFLSRRRLVLYLGLLSAAELAAFWLLRKRILLFGFTLVVAAGAAVWLLHCHLALVDLASDTTNVDFAIVTRKQLEAGDFAQAESSAREFAQERVRQVRPQADLVEVLYRGGKTDEARMEFEKLREIAGLADLDSPPLARLAPIAREFGLPADWRRTEPIQQALAGRRPLSSLGPLCWRPWPAPTWKLTDAQGKRRGLEEFKGKPMVLIFFLGRGCLHCQQQLAAFSKQAADFAQAGLTLAAVSTDDQPGVKKLLADFNASSRSTDRGPAAAGVPSGNRAGDSFPFVLLADPSCDVFRAYRAYDDFEQIPLHGTFVIDAQGLVRWQDVSFEPFLDARFVLAEAKRLFSRPVAPAEPDARVIASER